ncbi:MAG TPA: hypothetical protein VK432_04455 [Stellaceae bacterium]|nr:hypothetical protein [Stellaceae bacterium]
MAWSAGGLAGAGTAWAGGGLAGVDGCVCAFAGWIALVSTIAPPSSINEIDRIAHLPWFRHRGGLLS